jgi:hypothetical protein
MTSNGPAGPSRTSPRPDHDRGLTQRRSQLSDLGLGRRAGTFSAATSRRSRKRWRPARRCRPRRLTSPAASTRDKSPRNEAQVGPMPWSFGAPPGTRTPNPLILVGGFATILNNASAPALTSMYSSESMKAACRRFASLLVQRWRLKCGSRAWLTTTAHPAPPAGTTVARSNSSGRCRRRPSLGLSRKFARHVR